MKLQDIFARAGRSLRNAKGRTVLTSLAIAVGAFTLTLSLAAGEGARQYADKLISSNVDPQSLFVVKDDSVFGGVSGGLQEYSATATQYGGISFKTLSAKDLEIVSGIQGVESVTPTYIVPAEYVTFEDKDTKYTTDITAYDPSVRSEVAAGNLPPLGQQIESDAVVVPQAYAEQLGIKPKELVGQAVTLRLVKANAQLTPKQVETIIKKQGIKALQKKLAAQSKDVKLIVVAVSAKSSTALSTSNGLFISEVKAKELSDYLTKGTDQYQQYVSATVKVKDGVDPEKVKEAIGPAFEKEDKNSTVSARSAKDLQALLFTIVNTLQGIVGGFGVIALIASVFGIINTQYISVLERTREIGLMKALGMRGHHVSRLFQFEAAWIGLLGGIIGAGIAWGVGYLLNPWITEQLSLGDGTYLLIFQPIPIAVLILVLVIIAMLAGWFPARKAAKLDPIEALRTE